MDESKDLYALLAPVGQLAGNGQLRETLLERRNRKGQDVAFWYLSSELVRKFNLSLSVCETVVADDSTAIDWLRLRFGGEVKIINLDENLLRVQAMELPPPPNEKDISFSN